MNRTTDFLTSIRRIIKLHESMLKEVCERYQLSLAEANVISFLYNNPGKDTAGDIVELRMMAKGNVSQAVESLIQKALLQRRPDTSDRRRIHLSLLPKAKPVTDDINRIRKRFQNQMFWGFSEEERDLFAEFNNRIMENTKNLAERGVKE